MNGIVQQVKAMGEEKVGQLAAKLLSNQKFVQGIQTIVSRSLEAKETVDRNMQMVMGALGMPTVADHRESVEKLEALERDLEEMRDQVERLTEEMDKIAKAARKKPAKPRKKATKKKS